MKPLVIYHDKCTDGFAAAFAAWLAFGDDAEYLPMNYGQDFNDVDVVGREVYILDFSFSREVMDNIFTLAHHVVWLDHHKTAFEMWCEKYEKGDIWDSALSMPGGERMHTILLDDNRSGAMLAWHHFHPDFEVPLLIRHIDDRDRWQWKMEGSAELHAALQSNQPWSFYQWEHILDLRDPVSIEQMIDEGWAILRAQKQHVGRIAQQAVKCHVPHPNPDPAEVAAHIAEWELPMDQARFEVAHNNRLPGLAVNTPIFQSEVGNELATTGGSFGLAWYLADNNRVRCSFRSNGDYDVSAIAAAFGGGGHRNAAGCEVSLETLKGWLK